MAVAWTDITNAQVAAGAAGTTSLFTALRDNPEGMGQRATGAPKIFGVPYDYQEFTTSGTWTKPSNAEAGDRVRVLVIGGAQGGQWQSAAAGGFGGGGTFLDFNIDDFDATVTVTVGAGGAGATVVGGARGNGGNSDFGLINSTPFFMRGEGGTSPGSGPTALFGRRQNDAGFVFTQIGGSPLNASGGTAGNASSVDNANHRANGLYGGKSGESSGDVGSAATDYNIDGTFPGGGGGAVSTNTTGSTRGGDGADGVVRVWCIKEG